MRIRRMVVAIAIAVAAIPFPPVIADQLDAFHGDVYTVIGDCIYDGDGNVTECGIA